MLRTVMSSPIISVGLAVALFSVGAVLAASAPPQREDYIREPLPPGFQVIATELDGPVFADANGRTLYVWPLKQARSSFVGEQPGKPTCGDTKYTRSAGYSSVYPEGFELPDAATRKSCIEVWPPSYGAENAKPVGKWTMVDRPDKKKQWAYDGMAVYTSVLDRAPGDVNGGTNRKRGAGDRSGSRRDPIGPKPYIPPQFNVTQVATGRLLSTSEGFSLYMWDKDGPNKSNCDAACLREWAPALAPDAAPASLGEWSVFERSPGVKQWAFRGNPLYTHRTDLNDRGLVGSDVPGWHNVYTQRMPAPPAHFTIQDTLAGQVLADERGRTVYVYFCVDDTVDQQICDHPDTTQAYRIATCGDSDPARCLQLFPYLVAATGAKSVNHLWTAMDIDPMTGQRAMPGQAGSLRVWAFRDRPVYSCARDKHPGDIECDAWGDGNGFHSGFKAFWLRYDYNDSENAG